MKKMITLKKVQKKYGDFQAVESLDLEIRKGEILGFLGPNGAGKSTTMKMITSFIPPTGGEIRIGKESVAEDSVRTRSRIGYLPENNPLYPELTVEEFLDFVAEIKGVLGDHKKERLDFVIENCSLQSKRHKLIATLSKGFRQRVGLAQALIGDPDILILDEPTIGLDPNQIVEIRDLIRKISKNKTIIFCSHILSEVEAICSRVVIIDQGKVKASGKIGELTESKTGKAQLSVKLSKANLKIEELAKSFGEILEKQKATGSVKYFFELQSKDLKEFKQKLLSEIVDSKADLLEMSTKSFSLEDVFRKLTG